MKLKTLVPTSIGPARIPIVFPDDLGFALEATYVSPVPYYDYQGDILMRTEESTLLQPCTDLRPLTGGHELQERNLVQGNVAIDASFYWPPYPTGSVAGCAP
jgi:hypothetical protein